MRFWHMRDSGTEILRYFWLRGWFNVPYLVYNAGSLRCCGALPSDTLSKRHAGKGFTNENDPATLPMFDRLTSLYPNT